MTLQDQLDIDDTIALMRGMTQRQQAEFIRGALRTFWRGWRAIKPDLTMDEVIAEYEAWRDLIERRSFELELEHCGVAGHA
jgi:hypothetical protein